MTGAHPTSSRGHINYARLTMVLIPLIAIVLGWAGYQYWKAGEDAQAATAELRDMFKLNPTENRLSKDYTDADGDLIADPPKGESKLLRPDTLTFSHIAAPDNAEFEEVWKSLNDAISDATGLPVEYVVYTDRMEQLKAIKRGDLHICALNTGAVPQAVNACGYVPVSMMAKEDGSFGYRMEIIVPTESHIKKLKDLRGERITFTSRNSNSGFKAPVVLLSENSLQPIDDYEVSFSTSHNESIMRISRGELAAAPVAGDLLQRAVARWRSQQQEKQEADKATEGDAPDDEAEPAVDAAASENAEEDGNAVSEEVADVASEQEESDEPQASEAIVSDEPQADAAAGDAEEEYLAVHPDSFRTIYQSERFPPAAFGYVYNLDPEIAEKVRTVLENFEFESEPLVEEYTDTTNVSRLVPVTYKDDWSIIRRIDNAFGAVHEIETD